MNYTVAVKTGDIFGGGTAAGVFIQINGELGSSAEIPLSRSINGHTQLFCRNQTDIFAIDTKGTLGNLRSIKIRHDGNFTNLANAWYLEGVEVVDRSTNIGYVFPCKRWLAEQKDDGEIQRLLPCTKQHPWIEPGLRKTQNLPPIIVPQQQNLVQGKKKKMKKMQQAQAMGMGMGGGYGHPGMMGGGYGYQGMGGGYGNPGMIGGGYGNPGMMGGGYGHPGMGGGYGRPMGMGGMGGMGGGYGRPMAMGMGMGLGMGLGRMGMKAGSWSWSWS